MSLNHFDAIFYINLEHRTDRKNDLLKELKRLKVDKTKIFRINAHHTPLNGHLGCCLSHIDAIDQAMKNDLDNILLLEDDCYFLENSDFVNSYIEYFLHVVKKWDVFILGGKILKFKKAKYPYILKVEQSIGAHAYIINKHYFSILKNNFIQSYEKLKKCVLHNDSAITQVAIDRSWQILQKKDNWYMGNVLIAGQKISFSDIEHKNMNYFSSLNNLNKKIISRQ